MNFTEGKQTMKFIGNLLILFLTLLTLVTSTYAQSPREELKQMVEQLQQSPNDTALREKIIKLSTSIKPAPTIPEEAERRMARGAAAFKGATSVAGYQDAAKEFEQATLAAPWYGDAYYNLGVAQDKAGDYEAALRSLKLAQLASHDSKATKMLIYEVEFRNEKANSPEARAANEQEASQRFIASLEGAKYDCHETRDGFSAESWKIEITQGKIHGFNVTTWSRLENKPVGFRAPWFGLDGNVQGRVFQSSARGVTTRVDIYDDRLVVNQKLPEPFDTTCLRR